MNHPTGSRRSAATTNVPHRSSGAAHHAYRRSGAGSTFGRTASDNDSNNEDEDGDEDGDGAIDTALLALEHARRLRPDATEVADPLRKAVRYAVGAIARHPELANNLPAVPTRVFVTALAEVVFRQMEIVAKDLEAFAKHRAKGKVATIMPEDVLLLARRNLGLQQELQQLSQMLSEKPKVAEPEEGGALKKRRF